MNIFDINDRLNLELVAVRKGDPRVYIVCNNVKYWLVNAELIQDLGLSWKDLVTLDKSEVDNLPTGVPMTSINQQIYDLESHIICIERTWSDDFATGIVGWAVGKNKALDFLDIGIVGAHKEITSWLLRPEIFEYFKVNSSYPVGEKCGFSIVINRGIKRRFNFVAGAEKENNIIKYRQFKRQISPDVDVNKDLANEFQKIVNSKRLSLLEVGSRISPGGVNKRPFYKNAKKYVGFDYYPGQTVDVVGDAHRLSSYFDEKLTRYIQTQFWSTWQCRGRPSLKLTKCFGLVAMYTSQFLHRGRCTTDLGISGDFPILGLKSFSPSLLGLR